MEGGHEGLLIPTPVTLALEGATEGTGPSNIWVSVTFPGECEGIPWLSLVQGHFHLSLCSFGHIVCKLLLLPSWVLE